MADDPHIDRLARALRRATQSEAVRNQLYEIAWLASPEFNSDWEGGRAPRWDELVGDLAFYREQIIKTVDAILPAVSSATEELIAQTLAISRVEREGKMPGEIIIYTDDDLQDARAVIAALSGEG